MRLRAEVPAETVVFVGLDDATPGPGVIDAITDADLVVLPPSNPVVSVGTDPRRARGCARRWRRPRPRWSASPPSSAAPTCAAWPSSCSPRSASRSAPPAVGLHYGARTDGGRARRLAGRRGRRRRRSTDVEAAGARVPRRTADDDRPRRHRRDGRGRDRPGRHDEPRSGCIAPDGVPEVRAGDDLVALLLAAGRPRRRRRRRGDQQGREQGRGPGPRRHPRGRAAPARPSGSSPAAGATTIVRTRLGLTMAAAGIDNSNVEPGRVVLLPVDPDASARAAPRTASASAPAATSASSSPTPPAGPGARARPTSRSAPPACRSSRTYAGRVDAHGNELAVTAPAVADEIAGAAELAQGKLGGRPFAVVRGRADLVLPPGERRPGRRAPWSGPTAPTCSATAPARPSSRALRGDAGRHRGRSARPAAAEELVAALRPLRPRDRPPHETATTRALPARRPRPGGGRRASRSPTAGSRFGPTRRRRCPVPPGHSVDSALDTDQAPRGSRSVAKTAKTDRQAGHRRDPQEAEGRRAAPRVRDRRRLRRDRAAHRRRRGLPARSRTGGTSGSSTTSTSPRSAPPRRCARTSPRRRPSGSHDHVPADPAGRPTTDAPPAFGPHWNEAGLAPAPFERKLYTDDDRPELESLVHNLEHGYTILWYDETIADDDDQMLELRAHRRQVRRHRQLPHEVHRRAVDRPRTARPSPTASTSRSRTGRRRRGRGGRRGQVGVWQYCSEVVGEALDDFMKEYPYTDSPEPNAM